MSKVTKNSLLSIFKKYHLKNKESINLVNDRIDNLPITSNPNLLINGDFQVWQRGTIFTANSNARMYTADRWAIQHQNQSVTRVANTSPALVQYALRTINETGTADGQIYLYQPIEGSSAFHGKIMTLSFWVKSATQNSIYLCARVGTDKGIGMTITSEWKHFTVTINPVNIGTGYNSGVIIYTTSAAPIPVGGGFEVAGVKLELGTVATPFVPRLYAEELAMCQRYYYTYQFRSRAYWMNSNSVFSSEPCPIMRTIPTICLSDARIGRVDGQWETDFSFKGSCENLGNIFIEATKSSHNLTDAYIRSFVVADAEIY